MNQMRISIDNLYVERKSGLLEDPCNYLKEEGICFSSFLIKIAILQSKRYVTNPILKVYQLWDNSVGIINFRDLVDPGNDYILRDLLYKNQEPSSLFYYIMFRRSMMRIALGNNMKERFIKFNKDKDFEKIDTSFLIQTVGEVIQDYLKTINSNDLNRYYLYNERLKLISLLDSEYIYVKKNKIGIMVKEFLEDQEQVKRIAKMLTDYVSFKFNVLKVSDYFEIK